MICLSVSRKIVAFELLHGLLQRAHRPKEFPSLPLKHLDGDICFGRNWSHVLRPIHILFWEDRVNLKLHFKLCLGRMEFSHTDSKTEARACWRRFHTKLFLAFFMRHDRGSLHPLSNHTFGSWWRMNSKPPSKPEPKTRSLSRLRPNKDAVSLYRIMFHQKTLSFPTEFFAWHQVNPWPRSVPSNLVKVPRVWFLSQRRRFNLFFNIINQEQAG